MSLSLNAVYDNIGFALSKHTAAMAQLQEQAATGSRINRASDDPLSAYKVLGLNTDSRSLKNYEDNISSISESLSSSSDKIQSVIDTLTTDPQSVKTLITQVTGGIYNPETRARTATNIDGILEQIVSFANSKHTNQYLFGGNNTNTPPYSVERVDGRITKVIYQGSDDSRSVEVSPGVKTDAFYAGGNIFGSDNPQTPEFVGDSGAKTGTGTSSIRGTVWMKVINDGTNYKISIDDGATYTTVPVGGQANQAVTDSTTGRVLYVDTTGINKTGTDMVQVPGTNDVFNTLITIRDILNNSRGLSDSELKKVTGKMTPMLDEVNDHLVGQSSIIGSKIQFLDNLKENITNLRNNTSDETTRVEEADVAQIAIDLSRRQTLYQMSLSAAGKMLSMSLLDFIQ